MRLPDTAGQLIRAARRKKRMGQVEFGKTLGVSQNLLSRYERGVIENPPASVVIRCANIMLEGSDGVGEDEILFQKLRDLASDQRNVSLTVREIIEALDQYMQSH